MTEQTQTMSIKLSDMTLAELVQLNQGIGHDIERLREQRKHLQKKIAERLFMGEHEHPQQPEPPEQEPGEDAAAPGATIDTQATG